MLSLLLPGNVMLVPLPTTQGKSLLLMLLHCIQGKLLGLTKLVFKVLRQRHCLMQGHCALANVEVSPSILPVDFFSHRCQHALRNFLHGKYAADAGRHVRLQPFGLLVVCAHTSLPLL